MKKIYLLMLLITASFLNSNAQLNVSFKSQLTYPFSLSNICGYVDSLGNEYALVGTYDGLSIVDVTDPANPIEKFTVSGTSSDWREIKTWQHYAYVTTEGCCNGLQIIDLGDLPNSINSKFYTGDGAINNLITTIHALHIDAGYAYLYGSNHFSGAAIILDLADPWNPVYQGHTPGTYIHDGYVRNNTLYAGHIYDGYFSVMDVTNKSNPLLLATQSTPNQFTHNTWLNDAGNVLFTTDEVNNSYLASYDVSNINNIKELDRIQLTPGSGSIVHNTHTLNDYEIVSWYKDGIGIVDVSRPDNMIVVGSYDTYTQGSGGGFAGCWGVYPYLPSGNLVISDIDNGLFVLSPTYIRGCYLEGITTDSSSGAMLNGVKVEILNTTFTKYSKITGEYKTGLAAAGTYDIKFSKAGYITKVITGVNLQNGVLVNLDVALVSIPSINLTGTITDQTTGLPIANATVQFINSQFSNTTTTNSLGQYSIQPFFPENYSIHIGKWGYISVCDSGNVSNSPRNYSLLPGYYDDFTMDFGWTVSGPSPNAWERGVPVATYTGPGGSVIAAPGNDDQNDCSTMAYVTDNGGGGPWDNDVDQGETVLTSPQFDATTYVNPLVNYSRWFYNGGQINGAPDDTMSIELDNGITTVTIEKTYAGQPNQSTWHAQSLRIADYITPTNNMHLTVRISDPGPVFNIVEGGFDFFSISELTGLNNELLSSSLQAYPNPFNDKITILLHNIYGRKSVVIYDMLGKVIQTITTNENQIEIGQQFSNGFYIVKVIDENKNTNFIKIVKNK